MEMAVIHLGGGGFRVTEAQGTFSQEVQGRGSRSGCLGDEEGDERGRNESGTTRVDLTEGHDLAHVMKRVEPPPLEL